jgi:phosphate transport system ATP-binding protein
VIGEADDITIVAEPEEQVVFEARDIAVRYSGVVAVEGVSLDVFARRITALIGPSGCGKSTLLRTFNRMNDLIVGAEVSGRLAFHGHDLYAPNVDPIEVRRRIGMVFQKANPFPTMSIFDNVAAGLRLGARRDRTFLHETVEQALRKAALWDEVKNDLGKPGSSLSGGQQQRLCIARALAVEPEVLLMDEPCSALDPIATARIEELTVELKKSLTVVIVTHNMQQAARVAEWTGFFLLGELIEFGVTRELFTNPRDKRTEDYITGRFG